MCDLEFPSPFQAYLACHANRVVLTPIRFCGQHYSVESTWTTGGWFQSLFLTKFVFLEDLSFACLAELNFSIFRYNYFLKIVFVEVTSEVLLSRRLKLHWTMEVMRFLF